MTDPINNPTPSPSPRTTPATPATNPPAAEAPPRRGKLGRVIKWTFLILLLLVIGGGTILWVNLNKILKHTIETQSTAQLNLKTELDAAMLSIFGGELKLKDLRIANPPGFAAPQMFQLSQADVNVKVKELRGDPVRVQSITLDKPKLVVERTGDTFNFKKAMDLMPKAPEKPADQSKPLRLIIDELTISDPTVVVRPGQINIPGVTLPEEITVTLPTISMKNIGTGEGAQNGAAVKDVVMQVITVMAANAANSDKLPDQLKNLLNVDVQQVVAGLTAEAQKRIVEAVPGEAGKVLANVIADPNALIKDPGKVVGAEAGRIREQAQQQAQKRVEGLIGNVTGGSTQPSSQPATNPADRVKQEAGKAVEKGLQDLFNRDKKKKDQK
jgi:AsmA-like protein